MAVLPFSGHELCDGLTTRLIAELAACTGLRVISSTSVMRFKHQSQDPIAIGRQLNVELLLEGSVRPCRRAIPMRLAVGLVGRWSASLAGSFDSAEQDTFAVEDEFADQISKGVRCAFLQ